jgi:hypothetical protein
MRNRVGVRLGAVDPDVLRLGAELSQIVGLLLTALGAILARLGEHDDARRPAATREVDELLNERGRLWPTADDQ